MSELTFVFRFAVVAMTAAILVGAAALEIQGKVASQVGAVPQEHSRAIFDRDFDFDIGHILPTRPR